MPDDEKEPTWDDYLKTYLEPIKKEISELKQIADSQVAINEFYHKEINELEKKVDAKADTDIVYEDFAIKYVEIKEEIVDTSQLSARVDLVLGVQTQITELKEQVEIQKSFYDVAERNAGSGTDWSWRVQIIDRIINYEEVLRELMISLELYVKGNIDRRKIRNDLKILLEKLDAKEAGSASERESIDRQTEEIEGDIVVGDDGNVYTTLMTDSSTPSNPRDAIYLHHVQKYDEKPKEPPSDEIPASIKLWLDTFDYIATKRADLEWIFKMLDRTDEEWTEHAYRKHAEMIEKYMKGDKKES